jgi:RNA polymerase sigma-70 factor (ECF subfamily)
VLARGIERIWRDESGRILASLVRQARDLDLAEDALQDAWERALARWPRDGLPERPGAWLQAAAQNRLVDLLRRRRSRGAAGDAEALPDPGPAPDLAVAGDGAHSGIGDDRLRLVFTCCHPALSQPAQVGLTLRTLGGLTTAEVARAFLEPEAAAAQRLVRAKRKIREARIPYEVPSREELPERLGAVLAVVYLVFNEGYLASQGEALVRQDLCAEAVRLARTVADLLPGEPEALGLLALVLLHDSRRAARAGPRGELVPLEEQDRSLWDRAQIDEGVAVLDRALALGRRGPYQLQAAVAALHATAPSPQATDWRQIALLYGVLRRLADSPAAALAEAAAVAMADGPEAGLSRIEALEAGGTLAGYHLLPAARADLLRRLGRREEARAAYARALGLCRNAREREYLERRLSEVSAPGPAPPGPGPGFAPGAPPC